MKKIIFALTLFIASNGISQQDQRNRSHVMPGPTNMAPGGIVDGVVLATEVPMRDPMQYEYVRLADYVWSKRVFSRIDAREKINHELFYPFDKFDSEWELKKDYLSTIEDAQWVRHHERYSLWTIILKHILKGDLRIFHPYDPDASDPYNPVRDGFQFKYPIASGTGKIESSKDGEAFFSDQSFRDRVIKRIANFVQNGTVQLVYVPANATYTFVKTNKTYQEWLADPGSIEIDDGNGTVISLEEFKTYGDEAENAFKQLMPTLEAAWNFTKVGDNLTYPPTIKILSSQAIVAYNIKEDWFFDKERSMLDKRIIGIAPVAEYVISLDPKGNPSKLADESNIVYYEKGVKLSLGQPLDKKPTFQTEMFWLYFPHLRDVMVNYYTYNDKSDAQWMTFDDLFWKRKFNAQIYRTSDKFDRNIEDYRFGVDALREAEKIKGEIRKWEHDVWNY
jgi:hypothetical protein